MTEWYYIPTSITCPELKGPGLLDEVKRVEHLDAMLLRLVKSTIG
jgi:hypothetical protein